MSAPGEEEPLAPSADDGLRALRDHAVERALAARARYGDIGFPELLRILQDPEVVRFPTELSFDAGALEPGEFAHAQQRGARPSDGFVVFVHPHFEGQPDVVPFLVAYHLVRVNYGDMATTEAAESFGAALLGTDVEAYYRALCGFADEVAALP